MKCHRNSTVVQKSQPFIINGSHFFEYNQLHNTVNTYKILQLWLGCFIIHYIVNLT